jgi:hypothetical protein
VISRWRRLASLLFSSLGKILTKTLEASGQHTPIFASGRGGLRTVAPGERGLLDPEVQPLFPSSL